MEDVDETNYLPCEGLYDKGVSELPNDDSYNNHNMIIMQNLCYPVIMNICSQLE